MKKISDHKEINGCEEVKDCMRIGSKVSVNYKNKTPVSFSEIKGGISFPTLSSPGYYCLIGRRSYVDRNLKAPLILLSEHEEAIPDDLFKRLCEDARKYFCLNFYADVDEAGYAYYNDFICFTERLNMGGRIQLMESEIMDFNAGILRIQKKVKGLELKILKNTILHSQLIRMDTKNKKDIQKAEFYAVNALRCVIGSFDIPPTTAIRVIPSNWIYC